LAEDQNLTNAACWLALDLDINGFSHTDSLGRSMSQRLADFGVSGSRAENIFYTTAGSSASYAFEAWKNSSGHNTNMLNGTYTRIGIGRANVSGKWYWVTDFANGSASALSNQCGSPVSNPSTPTASNPTPNQQTTQGSSKPITAPSETPVSVLEPTPPVATITAQPSLKIATKPATPSNATVKIVDQDIEEPITLVKGLVLGSILLINFLLFAFIFWRFFRFQSKFGK